MKKDIIKIGNLTVPQFCRKYHLSQSTVYKIFKSKGDKGVIEFLIKVNNGKFPETNDILSREIQISYNDYRKKLNNLVEEHIKEVNKLCNELTIYQIISSLLFVTLISVLIFN